MKHLPFGITAYERKTPLAQKAVYLACAIGFVAALVFNNFHWN